MSVSTARTITFGLAAGSENVAKKVPTAYGPATILPQSSHLRVGSLFEAYRVRNHWCQHCLILNAFPAARVIGQAGYLPQGW